MPILKDLEKTKRLFAELNSLMVIISAVGRYRNKRATKVQDVAKYQNDGTETIKPSHFVERAERKNKKWKKQISLALKAYLRGDIKGFHRLGEAVAKDINKTVDRIDTRRLMHSMRHTLRG